MALKLMRDNLKHLKFILWGVVLIFILLVFVDWGSGRAGKSSNGSAVTVGKHQVSEQDFLKQVKNLQENYKRQLGDNWDRFKDKINLGQQAANQIIQRQLMMNLAEKSGIVVSGDELREEILSYKIFTDENGNFIGKEKYKKVLRSNRSTPQEFEDSIRQELLLKKFQALMEDSVYISDAEVDEALRKEQETATIQGVQLRYERYLAKVQLKEEEIKSYYEENRDSFSRPEERVIRYLVVETNKLRNLLKLDDAEIESYYKEHSEDFHEGEQVQASHILFKLNPGSDPAAEQEVKFKAEQVLKIAEEGGDFAELAKKYSEDPGSKANGGDLGWFGRGRMVKEFEQAVFGAKPGDILGPVKSQFGYHIIKVMGSRPERIRPLDEVRKDVRFRLLETRAADESKSRAEALIQRIKNEKPETNEAWQKIADEDEAVSFNESPAFAETDTIPGTGSDPELTKDVFKASEGTSGGPRPIPRGWMVWTLKEISPEGVPPFEKARAEAEQKLRQAKALELATQAAEALVQELKAGGDLDALAAKFESKVVEVKDHRRGTAFASLGVLPALDTELFKAQSGDILGPIVLPKRGAIVARVDALKLLNDAALETGRKAKKDQLRRERANELMSSMLSEARRNTTVTVDNEIVARFAPRKDQG